MKNTFLFLLAIGMVFAAKNVVFAAAGPGKQMVPLEAQDQGKEVNNGQDLTRPLTRVDIRQKYQELELDKFASVTTIRMDKPFPLENRWVLATRLDIPFSYTDVPSADNPDSDREFGASDFLSQVVMIAPQGRKKWTWAYGAQLLFPTASQDEMGTGRYQVAPLVAIKADASAISKGSFFIFLLRNHIDAGGYGNRAHQNYLVIQPICNVNLPKFWFVTLAPEIRCNYQNHNNWNVPFDVTVGKLLNKTTVVSLEYKTPIVDDNYPLYDNELEARIGFFF